MTRAAARPRISRITVREHITGKLLIWATIHALAVSLPAIPASANTKGPGLPAGTAPGAYRYTNRLIGSHDPYLLLHAHNPVDWYPWGAEALAKAKRENKPIFLSVGYSTCYWCHVAERTIYSNPAIARLMNRWFVNIKVDREQRPDVDRTYMLATHVLTGVGAWPNNVFLTPDLKPFFAGSYFPPSDGAKPGSGFPAILARIHKAWMEHRKDQVLPEAERVFQAMQRRLLATETRGGAVTPAEWLAVAIPALLERSDAQYGGLGNPGRGPKFPQAPVLELWLADYRLHGNPDGLRAVTQALDAMAFGGIHDHVGGGFHRYATDPAWSIPHFEKMLYDNAQLLGLYVEAYVATQRPLYRDLARDIADYLRRDLMDPGGGFFTAQDSQVHGREGAAILWTRQEIDATLGPAASARFFAVYELTPLPDTALSPGAREEADPESGVLRIRVPIDDTLRRAGFQDVTGMLKSLAPERALLLAARMRRDQPARDDKILTGLNGLAISALARGGAALRQPEWLGWARMAAERIWALAYDPATGALRHEIYRGHVGTDGYVEDYAALGRGFMALFDATGETIWRDRAAALAKGLLVRFARPDGTLAAAPEEAQLPFLVEDSGDEDVPSGASAALDLLLRLAKATGNPQYGAAAERIARHLAGQVSDRPEAWPAAIAALNENPLPVGGIGPSSGTAPATANPGTVAAAFPDEAFHLPVTADHVHASAMARSGDAGDEIVVTLKIDGGYHINANPASFDYLKPTILTFRTSQPARIGYPQAQRFKPAFAPDGLDVYEGTVTLVASFPPGSLKARLPLQGGVTAQACDTQTCLPPSVLPISVPAGAN